MTPRDCELRKCSDKAHAQPGLGNKDIKDIQGSAYDKALKNLTPEEQSRINTGRFQNASQLLQNLGKANDKSYRESTVRRGMEKMKPKLEVVRKVVNTVGIAGGAEPTGTLSVVCGLTSAACSVSTPRHCRRMTMFDCAPSIQTVSTNMADSAKTGWDRASWCC